MEQMGCDLYIDRRVMPQHRRHRHSSVVEALSKRSSISTVASPEEWTVFWSIVRFPRPLNEITTSPKFAHLSILRCRAPVGVSMPASCASSTAPSTRPVSLPLRCADRSPRERSGSIETLRRDAAVYQSAQAIRACTRAPTCVEEEQRTDERIRSRSSIGTATTSRD